VKLLYFCGAAVLLTSVGCGGKKTDGAQAPPSATPAAASARPSPAVTARPAAATSAEPASGAKAEVEITGVLESKQPAASFKIFVSPKPCAELASPVGAAAPRNEPGQFFLEIFVPQGTQGYICAVSLNAKAEITGVASYPGNPITMQGVGEVTFSGVTLKVEPLSKPAPSPPGL
jgi:hypothetical protein